MREANSPGTDPFWARAIQHGNKDDTISARWINLSFESLLDGVSYDYVPEGKIAVVEHVSCTLGSYSDIAFSSRIRIGPSIGSNGRGVHEVFLERDSGNSYNKAAFQSPMKFYVDEGANIFVGFGTAGPYTFECDASGYFIAK